MFLHFSVVADSVVPEPDLKAKTAKVAACLLCLVFCECVYSPNQSNGSHGVPFEAEWDFH